MKHFSVNNHAPGDGRFTAPQFAIDEIADASRAQAERHHRSDEVEDVPDGFTDFNLTEVNDVITNGNSSGLNITFHLASDVSDAPVNAVPFNNMTANTVYARVENANGCYKILAVGYSLKG